MTSPVFLLRLLAAIGASAAFGLLAAPLLPLPRFPAAFVLAFGFGTAFMIGTGHRILIAVALRDPARASAASWSGATAGIALGAIGGWGVCRAMGGDPRLLLAAFAVALNIAYLPVKCACLLAGCCLAMRPIPGVRIDLRRIEIGLTIALTLLALMFWWLGRPALTATTGIGGHLALRYFSRWSRRRLPQNLIYDGNAGLELGPLIALLLIALGEGLWARG